jgi:lysophospholipase L1-like esterase
MSIVRLISKAAENRGWVDANCKNLTGKSSNRWVAVLDKAVIDSDTDLQKLARRLRKKLEERYAEVAMEFVTRKPIVLVL